jgi:hypothetical protein
MEVTFDPTQNRRRVKGDEFTIVDPMGISHIRQPEFHVSTNCVSVPFDLIHPFCSSLLILIDSWHSKTLSSLVMQTAVYPGISMGTANPLSRSLTMPSI